MIKKLYAIISICLLCAACGVKSEPEYKSQNKHNVAIHIA